RPARRVQMTGAWTDLPRLAQWFSKGWGNQQPDAPDGIIPARCYPVKRRLTETPSESCYSGELRGEQIAWRTDTSSAPTRSTALSAPRSPLANSFRKS